MNDDAIRQHLESSGALDAASLEEADQYARSRRRPLAEAIVELGLLSDTDVYRKGVAPAAGLKFVDVGSKRIPDAVVQRLPGNVAIDNRTVPVADLKGVLFVAIDDPERVFVLDNLGFVAGGEVRAALCTPAALERALEDYYGDQKTVGARGKRVQL